MERIVYEQIRKYFVENDSNTVYQHASKKEHSTTTALTQMTDDWLKELEEKKVVGAELLDLSSAFDISDHKLIN